MVGGEGERAGIVRQLWVEGGVRAWPWCNPFLHVTTRKFSCVTAEAAAAYAMFIHTFIYKSISQTNLLPPFLAYSLPHQASHDLLDLFIWPRHLCPDKRDFFFSSLYMGVYMDVCLAQKNCIQLIFFWALVLYWPEFDPDSTSDPNPGEKKTEPDPSPNKIFNLSYENFQ